MPSEIWSTFPCIASPPCRSSRGGSCSSSGGAVVGAEHVDEGGQPCGERAVVVGVVGCVGHLLADDAGSEHGPVAQHVVEVDVSADQAVLLHGAEELSAQFDES